MQVLDTMTYVNEVAELFRSRCGETKILGPMDYTIIAEWEKRQIPFDVVSCAIEEAYDQIGHDEPPIESVSHFHEIVKQKFREWLQGGTARA